MGDGVSPSGAELPGTGTEAVPTPSSRLGWSTAGAVGAAPRFLCLAELREAVGGALQTDKARDSRGSPGFSRSAAASFAVSPFEFRNANQFRPFWKLGRRFPGLERSFLKPELVWATFAFTKTPEKPPLPSHPH